MIRLEPVHLSQCIGQPEKYMHLGVRVRSLGKVAILFCFFDEGQVLRIVVNVSVIILEIV